MDFAGKKTRIFQIRNRFGSHEAISTNETRNLTDTEELIDLVSCPHGKVLHNIEEVKALCGVCFQPMCEECAKTTCSICQKTICVEHAVESKLTKSLVCSVHKLSELVKERWWRSKSNLGNR